MYYPPRGSDLVLDGITYHRIDDQDVPSAHTEVPVTLDDNGTRVPVCFEIPFLDNCLLGK